MCNKGNVHIEQREYVITKCLKSGSCCWVNTFLIYAALANLNGNSHMWLIAIIWNGTDVKNCYDIKHDSMGLYTVSCLKAVKQYLTCILANYTELMPI